ncbi:MAG: hypothetical protein D6719_01530 [Candidatus Dadabacteria bacterium]|nr:MAG: hypothetical protein D6719_01530 [Candidatus Dadabacteria bacterium]
MNRLSRNKESIKLELVSNAVNDPKAPNKKEILDKMQSYQDREIKNRISIIGPHRDDIIIWLNDKPSREYASQGQARTIILSLKLALLDLLADYLGEAPLVLLDDLDSELDSIRREQLYKTVTDHRCQIFITGTEFEGKKEPGAESKQFAVEDGRVLSMEKIVGKSRVGGQTGPRSNTF